jgi:hypothetical protein
MDIEFDLLYDRLLSHEYLLHPDKVKILEILYLTKEKLLNSKLPSIKATYTSS